MKYWNQEEIGNGYFLLRDLASLLVVLPPPPRTSPMSSDGCEKEDRNFGTETESDDEGWWYFGGERTWLEGLAAEEWWIWGQERRSAVEWWGSLDRSIISFWFDFVFFVTVNSACEKADLFFSFCQQLCFSNFSGGFFFYFTLKNFNWESTTQRFGLFSSTNSIYFVYLRLLNRFTCIIWLIRYITNSRLVWDRITVYKLK